ncbi:head maturation protease, ClpP-related [Bacillus velezensis]|uniref:head maturation protease, ClpP-related n=1 Tax=Bacillus velezensis TaxID=492670 RepID=UPI000CF85830|nr:head maturation protease, ClpP-related [Bacillus velezensis]AVI29859.1 Clp protease ClpP [Bacillus velezensis]UBM44969.1 Clp protease ClpP [Bacillus velezensis]
MTMKNQKNNKYWSMKASGDSSADVFIFGEVVTSGYEWDDIDTSATSFKKDLDALGDLSTINLHLNSPGGSVFDGVAISSMLKQHKATVNVYIDGIAASIASVIAMAGDTIFMPSNSMMMVHNPLTLVWGNAQEMRKQADVLDKISESMKLSYLERAGEKLDKETLDNLMDNETWLSAHEAVSYGLADEVIASNQVAASVSDELFAKYHNVPSALKAQNTGKSSETKKENLLKQKLQILKGDV